MTTKQDLQVCCLGAGMMASAILDGLVAKGTVSGPDKISCSDPFEAALTTARGKGYQAHKSNTDALKAIPEHNVIFICVKPNIVVDVCKDIMMSGAGNEHALIISVAAGITLSTLQENLPQRRVVRVMPNVCCLVGESASGYAMGDLTTDDDRETVKTMLESVGVAVEEKEYLLNAVTGLSGSGPAYVFQFIEALADGGVRVGLPRADAVKLAAQTVKGAAEMVLSTGSGPAELKDKVCSPGGTTIAGVDALEAGGLRTTTIQAVKAAARRSFQLGGTSEEQIASKYNL